MEPSEPEVTCTTPGPCPPPTCTTEQIEACADGVLDEDCECEEECDECVPCGEELCDSDEACVDGQCADDES